MRQITDKSYEYNIEMYFLYNDFNRAFDTANRLCTDYRKYEFQINL